MMANSTPSHFTFEVVYGFNILTPLYLLPFPTHEAWACQDGETKA